MKPIFENNFAVVEHPGFSIMGDMGLSGAISIDSSTFTNRAIRQVMSNRGNRETSKISYPAYIMRIALSNPGRGDLDKLGVGL